MLIFKYLIFSGAPPSARSKNFRAKPKQAGKKEGGLGERIFARLLCPAKRGWGWESVSAIPASAGRQNRKIFVSLIEKIFARGQLKNVKKIFLFCSPKRSGGWLKRWAVLPPCGRQLKVAIWIFVKKSSDFVQKVPPIFKIRILGDCCPCLAGRQVALASAAKNFFGLGF